MSIKDIFSAANLTKKIFNEEMKFIDLTTHNHNILDCQSTRLEMSFWPHDYLAAFSLDFDDLSPKTFLNDDFDYGGDFCSRMNNDFLKILGDFPYLRVTHFMIPNSSFKGIGNSNEHYGDNFLISNIEYQDYIFNIKEKFLRYGSVEIACHGFRHFQEKKRSMLQWSEFEFSEKEEIEEELMKAKKVFKNIGIEVCGVRPPGWGLGKNFAFVPAAKNVGFEYIAASNFEAGLNRHRKIVSNIIPNCINDIVNIPCTVGINWPIRTVKKIIEKMIKMRGLISLHGHYVDSDLVGNGLTIANVKNIRDCLEYLNQNYKGKIWYATMKEIANFWIAKLDLLKKYTIGENKIYISLHNKSSFNLCGLTLKIIGNDFKFDYPSSISLDDKPDIIILDIKPGETKNILIKPKYSYTFSDKLMKKLKEYDSYSKDILIN